MTLADWFLVAVLGGCIGVVVCTLIQIQHELSVIGRDIAALRRMAEKGKP